MSRHSVRGALDVQPVAPVTSVRAAPRPGLPPSAPPPTPAAAPGISF